MNNATFRRNLERQWNRLRNDINKLADTYDLPGLNGGGWNGGPGFPGPGGQGYPGPGGPNFPGGGGRGSATWSGRVDNIVQLVLQGNNLRAQDLTNSGMQTTSQNMNGSLPRRQVTVTANKFGGRGTVRVAQQPNRSNGFTAIVEISDPRGGADNYRVGINWESGGGFGREEPYQSGRIEWRGRVDNMVNVFITGSSVTNETVAGSPLVGENFTINGSLAARPGSVRVRKLEGRGTVQVIQQPSRDNDFTAIVRIFDDDGGPDNYRLEITW